MMMMMVKNKLRFVFSFFCLLNRALFVCLFCRGGRFFSFLFKFQDDDEQ